MFAWKAIISPLSTASYYITVITTCALCIFMVSVNIMESYLERF